MARDFASFKDCEAIGERYDKNERYIFIADGQTAGRGRLGRSFISDGGAGLYASFLFSPKVKAEELSTLTSYAAVCTANAIERLTGGKVFIKWVNDIYIGEKKAAGILTEAALTPEGDVDFLIVGIGVNIKSRDFGELQNIATSLEDAFGVTPDAMELAEEIGKELFLFDKASRKEYMGEYRRRSILLGKTVRVTPVAGEEYLCRAEDISDSGELIAERNGEKISLSAGDVSLHLR